MREVYNLVSEDKKLSLKWLGYMKQLEGHPWAIQQILMDLGDEARRKICKELAELDQGEVMIGQSDMDGREHHHGPTSMMKQLVPDNTSDDSQKCNNRNCDQTDNDEVELAQRKVWHCPSIG
jgi:hypothetical protein